MSYQFDSFTTDNTYLTLFKTTCCGFTCGIPRKQVIHRDRINFINYGRYLNYVSVFFSALSLFLAMVSKNGDTKDTLYLVSFCIISYTAYQYFASKLVICVGNVYFTSNWCCTNHESLIDWYRQQEMVNGTSNYERIV